MWVWSTDSASNIPREGVTPQLNGTIEITVSPMSELDNTVVTNSFAATLRFSSRELNAMDPDRSSTNTTSSFGVRTCAVAALVAVSVLMPMRRIR